MRLDAPQALLRCSLGHPGSPPGHPEGSPGRPGSPPGRPEGPPGRPGSPPGRPGSPPGRPGPSHDMSMSLRTPLEIMRRGRWSSVSSMKRYEAHARLQQELAKLNRAQLRMAVNATQQLGPMVRDAILALPVRRVEAGSKRLKSSQDQGSCRCRHHHRW